MLKVVVESKRASEVRSRRAALVPHSDAPNLAALLRVIAFAKRCANVRVGMGTAMDGIAPDL